MGGQSDAGTPEGAGGTAWRMQALAGAASVNPLMNSATNAILPIEKLLPPAVRHFYWHRTWRHSGYGRRCSRTSSQSWHDGRRSHQQPVASVQLGIGSPQRLDLALGLCDLSLDVTQTMLRLHAGETHRWTEANVSSRIQRRCIASDVVWASAKKRVHVRYSAAETAHFAAYRD